MGERVRERGRRKGGQGQAEFIQGKGRLSPDEQSNSIPVVMYMYLYVCCSAELKARRTAIWKVVTLTV